MASPHDSRAVANAILETAGKHGIRLTPMQLIKLDYLAHGWSLALLDHPLIKHSVQAWQYGPVIPNVYKAFSGYGSRTVDKPAVDSSTGLPYAAAFDPEEIEVIDSVVTSYGRMHAFMLSNMMHQEGTPWSITFANGAGAYKEIPQDLIKTHFKQLAAEREIAL